MVAQRLLFLILVLSGPAVLLSSGAAQASSLLRLEKTGPSDRNTFLSKGLPLIEEMGSCFLVVGDEVVITQRARALGARVQALAGPMSGFDLGIVGLREGTTIADLEACGEVLWQEEQWAILRTPTDEGLNCAHSPAWHYRPLGTEVLKPTRDLPKRMVDLAEHKIPLLTDPMVVEMVSATTDDFVMSHWQSIVDAASTRNSQSAGCQTATQMVHAQFSALGLAPQYQNHTSGHAPNVIGTILGQTDPSKVYIVIGHLDDEPSTGPAPGANDNASGSAMVTALAEVMSCYSFAYTVKFIVVTGEEYGLYGSSYYANNTSEDIQAVFNADMIGWEGNGSPNPEDLDLNMHSSFTALGTFFAQAAADYDTGCPVNLFTCDSMAYSDHYPFWQNGFPAVVGITDNEGFCGQAGSYPYYHTSADTIANSGPGAKAFEGAAVRAYLAAVAHMAEPLSRLVGPPTLVAATPAGDNTIDLTWTAAVSAAGYEVFRAPGGCSNPGPWSLVGSTLATTFSDTTVSGRIPYAFELRGVDATGSCRSERTTCVEASTTGACIEPPEFGGAVSVVNQETASCRLEVTWNPVDRLYCGSSALYSVYRSQTPGFTPSPATLIASGLSTTSHPDATSLSFEEPYSYIVRATDAANGAEESNMVEVVAVATGPIAPGTFSDDAGDNGPVKLDLEPPWAVTPSGGIGGTQAYATGSYADNLCSGAATPEIRLGLNPQLSFWTKFDIEDSWDKGEVQVSTDGGGSWVRVPLTYPGNSPYSSDACGLAAGNYFTGSGASYTEYTASLATWAQQTVIIRWVLSSDVSLNGTGWWLDDIEITDVEIPSSCTSSNPDTIFEDAFEAGDTSQWSVQAP